MSEMTARLRLTAEAREFSATLEKAQGELRQFGQQAETAHSGGVRALNAGLSDLQGSLQGAAARMGPLGAALSALGPAGIAAGAGIAGIGAAFTAAARAAAEAESVQLRLGAVLKATGNAAGFSQQQLSEYAAGLQQSLKINDEEIKGAMTVLATFRNVSGQTFREATVLAADMAAVFGGDMSSAAKQLGLALNDPSEGLTALRRAGVTFSEAQKDVIARLQETGDIAGAQKVILKELEDQLGGAAGAEAKGLAGSARGVANAWDEMLEGMGSRTLPAAGFALSVIEKTLRDINELAFGAGNATQSIVRNAQDRAAAGLDREAAERWRAKFDANNALNDGDFRAQFALPAGTGPQPRPKPADLWDIAGGIRAAEAEKIAAAAEKIAAAAQKAAPAEQAASEAIRNRARLLLDASEQDRAREQSLEDHLRGLERANALARMGVGLREEELALDQARMKAGRDLNAAEEARIRTLVRAGQAQDAQAQAAEKAAEEWNAIWERAGENMQRSLSGAFRTALDGGIDSFRDFGDIVTNLMKDIAAEIASALVFRPVVGGVLDALGLSGAGGSSGGGAIGALGAAGNAASLGNFLRGGSSLFGLGGAQGGVARLLSTGSLSSVGPIAPGFGTAIGAALPYVGATAAAIGLARGLGIFGPGKSVGANAGGYLSEAGGRFSIGGIGEDRNGGASQLSAVQNVLDGTLNVINAFVQEAGLLDKQIGDGVREAVQIFASGKDPINTTVEDLTRAMLPYIEGLSDAQRATIAAGQGLEGLTQVVNELTTAAAKAAADAAFPGEVADLLLQKTDPKAHALKILDAEAEGLRLRAQAVNDNGETLANIEKLYALERQEILERFGAAAGDVLENAADSAESAARRNAFAATARLGVLEYENPLAAALTRAENTLQDLRNQAVQLGAGVDVFADIERAGAHARQQILDDFNQRAVEAAQRAADAQAGIVESARARLTEAYDAEARALNDTISRFQGFTRSLKDFRQSLISGPLSNSSPETRLSETRRLFDEAAALARVGNADAFERLPELGRDYAQALRDYFGSSEGYSQGLSLILSGVDAAAATASRQAGIAGQQLDALNASAAGLISVNSAVFGVRDAVTGGLGSVSNAIAGLHAALADQQTLLAALAAAKGGSTGGSSSGGSSSGGSSSGGSSGGSSSGGSSGGSSSGGSSGGGGAVNPYAAEITALYQRLLNHAPDAAGLAYWSANRQSGQTYAQVAANIIRNAEFSTVHPGLSGLYQGIFGRDPDASGSAYWSAQLAAGVPLSEVRENFLRSDEFHSIYGYAKGGVARGWAMVGELGPELVNFTQPGRVYTAQETRAALGGGGEELAELRAQTRELQALVRLQQAANQALIAELAGVRAANEQQARLTARAAA